MNGLDKKIRARLQEVCQVQFDKRLSGLFELVNVEKAKYELSEKTEKWLEDAEEKGYDADDIKVWFYNYNGIDWYAQVRFHLHHDILGETNAVSVSFQRRIDSVKSDLVPLLKEEARLKKEREIEVQDKKLRETKAQLFKLEEELGEISGINIFNNPCQGDERFTIDYRMRDAILRAIVNQKQCRVDGKRYTVQEAAKDIQDM